MTDISQSEDTYHSFALVDHREPANVQALHVLHRMGEVIILAAAMDTWCHHIASGCLTRVEAVFSQSFADNISICDHSDEAVILPDWNGAYIVTAHQSREFRYWRVWANPIDTSMHCFFDSHGRPLLLTLSAGSPFVFKSDTKVYKTFSLIARVSRVNIYGEKEITCLKAR